MRVTTAFNRMLGLPGAWVRDVAFGSEAVIVTVALRRKQPLCAGCGARGLNIKDHRVKRWRHVDAGGVRCVIECQLPNDLASAATTPNYTFVTPSTCNDGHDTPCANGGPGGLAQADTYLKTLVPMITSSPAFKQNGLLIITFDEALGGPTGDSTACCGEAPGPGEVAPGIYGSGGGRVGAVLLSPYIAPVTTTNSAYNHYSMLGTVEDISASHDSPTRQARPPLDPRSSPLRTARSPPPPPPRWHRRTPNSSSSPPRSNPSRPGSRARARARRSPTATPRRPRPS